MSASTVLVVPEEFRDIGNRYFCAINMDVLPGNTFSRKLSGNGLEPATHYACHTMSEPALLETLTAIRNGTMGSLVPSDVDWSEWGTSVNDIIAFGESLSMHVQGEPQINALVFFNNVLSGLELQTVAGSI